MQKIKRFLSRLRRSFLPMRGDGIKNTLLKLLFLISLVTLILSGGWLLRYFAESHRAQSVVDAGREIWHSPELSLPDRFAALTAENPDFKAWLSIEGTSIDYPVYQTDNNAYYLTHDQRRQESRNGALFFSCDDTVDSTLSDQNLVIYGHNMKDGSMFAELLNYRKQAFYEQHPTVCLSFAEQDILYYDIFAVYLIEAAPENADSQPDLTRDTFTDAADFDSWIASVRARSLIKSNTEATYGDHILTLVTCGDDYAKTRLVVAGVWRTAESGNH